MTMMDKEKKGDILVYVCVCVCVNVSVSEHMCECESEIVNENVSSHKTSTASSTHLGTQPTYSIVLLLVSVRSRTT